MGLSRQEYWSDCHSLFQRMFLTQGSNPGLLYCQQILSVWTTGKSFPTLNVLRTLRLPYSWAKPSDAKYISYQVFRISCNWILHKKRKPQIVVNVLAIHPCDCAADHCHSPASWESVPKAWGKSTIHTSKFLLNMDHFCTVVKLNNYKLNHCKPGTIYIPWT